MNLVTDKWIPVLTKSNQNIDVSLNDIFTFGDEYHDVVLLTPQKISLYRLLICITQTALDGPKDRNDWIACRSDMSEKVLQYLKMWMSKFELYGDNAFLQVNFEESFANAIIDKLDFGKSCGHNSVWRDHDATESGRYQSDSELAINILTYQSFAPCGKIGHLDWDGISTYVGKPKEKNTKSSPSNSFHAPCSDKSLLLTFVVGGSIVDTIYYNLLTKDKISNFFVTSGWGKPYWELDSLSRENMDTVNHNCYLNRLVPVSRVIKCFENSTKMVLSNANLYAKNEDVRLEPFSTVDLITKDGKTVNSYISAEPSKHPWRDLSAILSLTSADKTFGGSLSLENIMYIPDNSFKIFTGGFKLDKAKPIDFCEWSFCVSRSSIGSVCLDSYKNGVQLAEEVKKTLEKAVRAYVKSITVDCTGDKKESKSGLDSKFVTIAVDHFWSKLDSVSSVLLEECLESGPTYFSKNGKKLESNLDTRWGKIVSAALFEAYQKACICRNAKTIVAYVKGDILLSAYSIKESSNKTKIPVDMKESI